MPFCEPGLGELLAKSAGRLRFGTKPDGVVHETGAIFVCVATPRGKTDPPTSRALRRSRGAEAAGAGARGGGEQRTPAFGGQQEHGPGGKRGPPLLPFG
jgi:hypothetical protein